MFQGDSDDLHPLETRPLSGRQLRCGMAFVAACKQVVVAGRYARWTTMRVTEDMRDPNHDCPNRTVAVVGTRLDALHQTQSGARRHRCVACAYASGYGAGREAANADRRVSSWLLQGRAEMCEDARSAPEATLQSLPENQGEHRHRCAVCAWATGWRDGVASVS